MTKGPPKTKNYVSKPLNINLNKLENAFKRADIEFHGVDHSGPSYEGRVFLNNPHANRTTPRTLAHKYVGSYHIFGHGGCYGDTGHCEVPKERRPYDHRPEHPLTPAYKRINATEALRALAKTADSFTVTIVPVFPRGATLKDEEEVIKLEKISIVTYD
jgi:hypothetical protein